MDWFMLSKNPYVNNLTHYMTILGIETLKKWLGFNEILRAGL